MGSHLERRCVSSSLACASRSNIWELETRFKREWLIRVLSRVSHSFLSDPVSSSETGNPPPGRVGFFKRVLYR